MPSLRRRLFAWLLPPLVLVAAVAAGGAYVFLERRLTAAYDLDLGDIARALVPYVRAVLDPRGRVVAGDHVLPTPPPIVAEAPYFWDAQRLGTRIRAAVIDANVDGTPVRVIAAETTKKRNRAYQDAMLSAIIPAVLLLLAALAGIFLGVRRGLGPLDKLREELQARSHVDLRPVDEGHMVDELRPLVHELNGMLARLDAAQDNQARFIANAAHQLRTPIAGVITQLDLAKSESSQRETHLARAREGAARLARLAHQILSLAAADPISNPGVREGLCDLADIVKNHADEWLRSVTARDVEIEFDLAPAALRCNALLVGELASNLVDNAARYGARIVTVATRNTGDRSLLEVTDDGHGIPRTERAHIFERFHRLDHVSTEGSGLGLAIVSEIAQRHGATIELADGREGIGTRVVVSFPAAKAVA
jgi:two-component system sensor histidine kinase TctE